VRENDLLRERKAKGEFVLLIKEMKFHDHALFFAYFRMSPTKYEQVLTIVAPRIQEYKELPYAIFLRMMHKEQLQKIFTLSIILSSHAALFTSTRHATKPPDWLLKLYDAFSARKGQKKLSLIQLSSEQNGTENFPVHVNLEQAHERFCSVPVAVIVLYYASNALGM